MHMPQSGVSIRPRSAVIQSPVSPLIARRAFLKGGLLAAGAVFGCSLQGCESDAFSIPCLGPAPPPKPVSGVKYIRASEIGCALDCNLSNGRNKYTGGTA